MPNGDWSLPFSACFVMKKVEDFNPNECSLKVAFTLIMRIKFTGCPHMEEAIKFCEK